MEKLDRKILLTIAKSRNQLMDSSVGWQPFETENDWLLIPVNRIKLRCSIAGLVLSIISSILFTVSFFHDRDIRIILILISLFLIFIGGGVLWFGLRFVPTNYGYKTISLTHVNSSHTNCRVIENFSGYDLTNFTSAGTTFGNAYRRHQINIVNIAGNGEITKKNLASSTRHECSFDVFFQKLSVPHIICRLHVPSSSTLANEDIEYYATILADKTAGQIHFGGETEMKRGQTSF